LKEKFSHNEIIENLKQHLLPCFNDINEFETLFPENKLHLEMLTDIAPNFFMQVNRMYYDKFILSISRLLDPAVQLKKENLSMFQLVDIAKETNYLLCGELESKLIDIKEQSKDMLLLRNKVIAHRDLNLSIINDLEIEVEFKKIKEIFSIMAKCINDIENHLKLNPTAFFGWIRDNYGTTALVRHLKNSLIYRDMRTNYVSWDEDEDRAKKSKFYNLP
jgi:hypothetical protein